MRSDRPFQLDRQPWRSLHSSQEIQVHTSEGPAVADPLVSLVPPPKPTRASDRGGDVFRRSSIEQAIFDSLHWLDAPRCVSSRVVVCAVSRLIHENHEYDALQQ